MFFPGTFETDTASDSTNDKSGIVCRWWCRKLIAYVYIFTVRGIANIRGLYCNDAITYAAHKCWEKDFCISYCIFLVPLFTIIAMERIAYFFIFCSREIIFFLSVWVKEWFLFFCITCVMLRWCIIIAREWLLSMIDDTPTKHWNPQIKIVQYFGVRFRSQCSASPSIKG